MDMNMLMGLMKDLPKFSAQAQELIQKARKLTEAVDRLASIYDDGSSPHMNDVFLANVDFKAALANLPRIPNVIEG